MGINLSGFKVVYDNKVLRALPLQNVTFGDNDYPQIGKAVQPEELEVMCLDENCVITVIFDKAEKFQFIPIVGG